MLLGISSYTFNWWSGVPGYPLPSDPLTPERLLNEAVSMGADVVQITDNLALEAQPATEIDRIGVLAKQRRLMLEVGTSGSDPDSLRRALDMSRRIGSRMLRTLLDKGNDRPKEDECIARLRAMASEFEQAGVVLGIENHDRFPAATLRRIVDRIGSPAVGICLDTANSLGCGEGIATVLDACAEVTVNLHIKDFQVRRLPHAKGFIVTGVPAGQGLLDIPAILARVNAAGRNINCILELWSEPDATIDESVRVEREWAAMSFSYLRSLIPARCEMDAVEAP